LRANLMKIEWMSRHKKLDVKGNRAYKQPQ
jgi:hypothetical protein